MRKTNHHCQTELIAPYLDGDLEPSACTAFEEHLRGCADCDAELQAQRLFICDLDSALAQPSDLPVPQNFARIVAAYAESDMSGARNGAEHKRALRFCVILALLAFALLGVAAGKSVFLSGQLMAGKVLGVFGLLWRTLHDAAVGLTVISRVVGQLLLPESHLAGLAALFLLALALVLLSLLISSYHRYHRMRVLE
jgi:predicted anti-sigma-YlaC factor YlaD